MTSKVRGFYEYLTVFISENIFSATTYLPQMHLVSLGRETDAAAVAQLRLLVALAPPPSVVDAAYVAVERHPVALGQPAPLARVRLDVPVNLVHVALHGVNVDADVLAQDTLELLVHDQEVLEAEGRPLHGAPR